MYKSNGVGLAAPQINKAIRMFVIDTYQIVEGFDDDDKRWQASGYGGYTQ